MARGPHRPRPLKLLLDEMLGAAIAEALRRRGHDVAAVTERAEWRGLCDPELLAVARAERRVIVTKNVRDFRPLAAEAIVSGGPGHAGMVFVPARRKLTRAATGSLVADLEVKLRELPGDSGLAGGETWL